MNPQSQRLSEMFSARLSDTAHDEVAGIVLGPRLCSLCVALGAPVRDWWQISRWATRLGDARMRDALGTYLDVLVPAGVACPVTTSSPS